MKHVTLKEWWFNTDRRVCGTVVTAEHVPTSTFIVSDVLQSVHRLARKAFTEDTEYTLHGPISYPENEWPRRGFDDLFHTVHVS